MLVKVRAPKLSKEFKPTKVYEILNDSLQTLTDEDLRAMVDAMEKMDEIQDSLDMLKRAFDDVKIIRNEYIRYNQYMLAKKAQGYLTKKQEVESAQRKLDAKEQEKREFEEAQKAGQLRWEELNGKKQLAETERSGLLDTDLEDIDRKLERAREQRADAEERGNRWEDKIQKYKEQIREREQQLRDLRDRLEQRRDRLQEEKRDLGEQQEILQWDQHEKALRLMETEEWEKAGEIADDLNALRILIEACRKVIRQYEEAARLYDAAAAQLEALGRLQAEEEQKLSEAQEQTADAADRWISALFESGKTSEMWHPAEAVLQEAEQIVRRYQSWEDAGAVREILHADYERQRRKLTDAERNLEYDRKIWREDLEQVEKELEHVRNQEDLEPERDENAVRTRRMLQKAGITAVPFYKAVEFAEGQSAEDCARIEAQLQKMGILDALVVSPEDRERIRVECPEFLDAILYAETEGASGFTGLTAGEELDDRLKETVSRILSHFQEEAGPGAGVSVGKDGCFRQGILAGKADKTGEAEFVGTLARKRKKEQRIQELQDRRREISEAISEVEREMAQIRGQMEILQTEYQRLPGFSDIDAALDREKDCRHKLQRIHADYQAKEAEERKLAQQKNQKYQAMLQQCKGFPYGRTGEAYEEAGDAAAEYLRIWQEVRTELLQIRTDRGNCLDKEEQMARDEQALDDAFVEKRGYVTKVREFDIQIRQYEEYLSRPEIAEKANRLKQLKRELEEISQECEAIHTAQVQREERLKMLRASLPEQKEALQQAIGEETCLRKYFEEELSLKLVLDRGTRTLSDCAGEALGVLRESDRNREPSDMLQALYQVYQRHNGSLTSYGTSLEDCFGAVDASPGVGDNAGVTRKRVRVVSVWNGKKVYLEEFYGILKSSIEETELLIQEKDRELFEDILSRTISRQLTDRIAESRKWVSDMSQLMKEMDTSMGLRFSLDWKPRKAENDAELDTLELEQILLRDRALLTMDDIEKVAGHFRSKIRTEKLRLEEEGGVINYMELVRDALDYRRWFEFQMYFRRGEEQRKPLTNAAFNRFSGGEKAMAMYVPLFAAVNAQYQKAGNKDHPRMIALDEAFAGVDDKNISSMFELVHKLDFDYIMNSQALWGCYETVKGLRIAELFRPQNSQTVSVIRYTWNGHERILDVQ